MTTHTAKVQAAFEELMRLVNEDTPWSGYEPLWLFQAYLATHGERSRDYGTRLRNFLQIALFWNIDQLGRRAEGDYLTPLDVARQNILQKDSRDSNLFKTDNWIDTIGYADCVDDMDRHLRELGYPDGVRAFTRMDIQEMFDLADRLARQHFSKRRKESRHAAPRESFPATVLGTGSAAADRVPAPAESLGADDPYGFEPS